MIQELNKELLGTLNSYSTIPAVEIFVKIFVDGPIFILPLFLSGYWIYYSFKKETDSDQKKEKLLLIFYGVIISIIISLGIQQVVHFDRPEQHLQAGAKLLLDHLPDASFPSDHATVGIAFIAGIFLAGYKKWFWYLLLPFLFMNVSRIIAGVHWPLDIIAGTLVGIGGAYFTFSQLSKLKFVKNLNMWIITLMKKIKL